MRLTLILAALLTLTALAVSGGPERCQSRVRFKGVVWQCERERGHGKGHTVEIPRRGTLMWKSGSTVKMLWKH